MCDIENKIKEIFLKHIGEDSLESVNNWFKRHYSNEWRLDGIEDAVKFVLKFKDKPITIVGDYDADGVTATSILYLGLKSVGFSNLKYRIPKRFSEGFGINPIIIDEIDSGLVITCDNGVAQVESINKAKNKGLSVVIIDHHQPLVDSTGKCVLPNADFIIDPNAIPDSADFAGYCGAGLCLKFIRELGLQCSTPSLYKNFLGLAAIGTVADVMELRAENYVIVRNGLKALVTKGINTVGLSTLVMASCGNSVTAHDIGFKIGPVINAASRMRDDGAKVAVELLTFNGDYNTAVNMTDALLALNELRKDEKKKAVENAENVISAECLYGDAPLCVYIPNTLEGIIGIVAGNLCDKYGVPAIVFTDSETEGILKGSARSCGACDIKFSLDTLNNLTPGILYKYGGHSGAAGLSIYKERLTDFRNEMLDILQYFESEKKDALNFDIEIAATDIPYAYKELQKYEPFGEGNEPIIFKVCDFTVLPSYGKTVTPISEGAGVRLFGTNAEAVCFDVKDFPSSVSCLNIVGSISANNFNGKTTLQVEFSGYEISKSSRKVTPLAAMLYSAS